MCECAGLVPLEEECWKVFLLPLLNVESQERRCCKRLQKPNDKLLIFLVYGNDCSLVSLVCGNTLWFSRNTLTVLMFLIWYFWYPARISTLQVWVNELTEHQSHKCKIYKTVPNFRWYQNNDNVSGCFEWLVRDICSVYFYVNLNTLYKRERKKYRSSKAQNVDAASQRHECTIKCPNTPQVMSKLYDSALVIWQQFPLHF